MVERLEEELSRLLLIFFRLAYLFKVGYTDSYKQEKEQEESLMAPARTISEITNRLTPIFHEYGVKKAVLFGSVAKGTATESSDVDLLVDSQLRGLRFVGLLEAVQNALLLPVDLLDVAHIECDSRIDREIRSTGVTIYEK